MSSNIVWALTAAQVVISLVGLATNGFVLGVNSMHWVHSEKLMSSDYFICCLAFSNLFLQSWAGADWICDLLQDESRFCHVAYALKMMSLSYSLLLTAWLCVFYCVRIVVFRNCLLRWLQRSIQSSFKYFIVLSILLCMVMGLPLVWTGRPRTQVTNSSSEIPYSYINIYRSILVLFGFAMPLFYVILSAAFILRSLRVHVKRMRVNMEGGHEAHLEAHMYASYTVLALLLLFFLNFVSSILVFINLYPRGSTQLFSCYLGIILYSPLHSVVLIRGNGKLRKASNEVIGKLFRMKDTALPASHVG